MLNKRKKSLNIAWLLFLLIFVGLVGIRLLRNVDFSNLNIGIMQHSVTTTQSIGNILSFGGPYCAYHNPTVTISPLSLNGYTGQMLEYQVILDNNNDQCGTQTFALSVKNCPSGWDCTLSQNSVDVDSGGEDSSITIQVTSARLASLDTFSFTVSATDQESGLIGEGSGSYVVTTGCDNGEPDGVCSQYETQVTCKEDCGTSVVMIPNANLIVGQPAQVTIMFTDGRWEANGKVNFSLVIQPEGIKWNVNTYCKFGGVILSSDGAGGTTKWNGAGISTSSKDYSFTTTFTCQIPQGLNSGTHTLLVMPTIYSIPTTLRAVQVDFTVASKEPDLSSYINSFIASMKSFLGIK